MLSPSDAFFDSASATTANSGPITGSGGHTPVKRPALDVTSEYGAYRGKFLSHALFVVALTNCAQTYVQEHLNTPEANAFMDRLQSFPRKSSQDVAAVVEALVAWCNENGVGLVDM